MKTFITKLCAGLVGAFALVSFTPGRVAPATIADAAARAAGAFVEVSARAVYTPEGYDDNDDVIMVVDGFLPSGCYRLARPEVDIDDANKLITVTPIARYFDVPCITSSVPYNFEVYLGQLTEGRYKIKVGTGNEGAEPLQSVLDVQASANIGPDDHLYAPVDQAVVDQDPETGRVKATLLGRFPNSCAVWQNIQLIDSGDTVAVLPIISLDESGSDCVAGEFPFKKQIDLPTGKETGRYLLHVRSLNGRSVNELFRVSNPD